MEDITDRTSTFLHLSTFNTRDINGQSRNYSSSIGLKYNLLCINNNMLSLILSYYRVMSYNKLLHFTQLDEIYNKLKTGITYNYDNSFSVGILYNKFYNSYKNSLKFFIEKTLLKNSYFISYLGYEHYRNINTSNSGTISYYYNNIQNLLQIKELLNREDILYWNTKVSFIKHTNISISIKFIDSLAFGKYSSIGLAFGFDI
ncbi:MAG: hypothetical protein LBG48_04125 [Rickettsiales bacterium]|nr:hypothetical protein [Rickettsiales bacterium]